MKIRGQNGIIGLVCFLLVFMITAQIKTIKRSESDILRLKTENELRDEINQWEDVYNAATTKINELNAQITEYQNSAAQGNKDVAVIKADLDKKKVQAGEVALKGPGIIVTLDDTTALEKIEAEFGYDPNRYIIHDSDLILIVNELRSAYAEAISINGQRITSNTAIRCVGAQIAINDIKMVAPFKISAIGEKIKLRGSLSLRGGIIDNIRSSNIDVKIEEQDEILIPAYEKTITYQYATIVEDNVEKEEEK